MPTALPHPVRRAVPGELCPSRGRVDLGRAALGEGQAPQLTRSSYLDASRV